MQQLAPFAPAAATLLLVTFVAWSWSGMWVDPPVGVVALATAAGAVPALVSLIPDRRAGLATIASGAIGAFLVAALATDVSMQSLLRLRRDAWRSVATLLDDGIAGAATITIPLPPDADSRAVSATLVVLLAMAIFLIAAIGIVTRRPLAAIVTAGIALSYRWTLAPPSHPLRDGMLGALVALIVFALLRPGVRDRRHHPARPIVAGAVVLALAWVLSIGASDRAWWDWRTWSWGSPDPQGAVLSLNQSYGALTYPDQPIELARVSTEKLAPLRAITLNRFDGLAFTEAPGTLISDVEVSDGALDLPAKAAATGPTAMTVSLTGTKTPWLFMGGDARRVDGLGQRRAKVFADGAVNIDPSLGRDAKYRVTSTFPDPGPAKLLNVKGYEPWDDLSQELTVDPGQGLPPITAPSWGNGDRIPADDYGPYDAVAERSREVIGDATTPYQAVNRVESYLRALPFQYDERAPRAVGEPELVGFLMTTQRGYCQHFAGAMALMLRMNGIPARVAVGLNINASRYDATTKSYAIVDRDAHSWVEVYFGPEHGWLTFDPTPGRSALNSASVSSSTYSTKGLTTTVASALSSAPVNPAPSAPAQRPEPAGPSGPVAATPSGGMSPWLWLTPLGLALVALLPWAVKVVRRLRRRRGDERARVLGAARELESLLVDLGAPPDPAATPVERATTARRDLGIDAARIYGLASEARYSPVAPAPGAGQEAWDELETARRQLGWRYRARAGMRLRSLRRDRRNADV